MLIIETLPQLAFTMFLVSLSKRKRNQIYAYEKLSLRAYPFAKIAASSGYLNSADQLRERERQREK